MRSRIVKDEQGRKWRVWPRGWYEQYTGRELLAMQQKAADEQRAKGRESYARAIENLSWVEWISRSGIISKKVRISGGE